MLGERERERSRERSREREIKRERDQERERSRKRESIRFTPSLGQCEQAHVSMLHEPPPHTTVLTRPAKTRHKTLHTWCASATRPSSSPPAWPALGPWPHALSSTHPACLHCPRLSCNMLTRSAKARHNARYAWCASAKFKSVLAPLGHVLALFSRPTQPACLPHPHPTQQHFAHRAVEPQERHQDPSAL